MKFDPTSAVRRVQPPRTVLIPLDSSDLSRRALPFASGLAKRGGGRLVLSHATWLPPAAKDWRDPLEVVLHEVEVAATADLEALAAPLRAEGVDVEVRVCGQAPDVGIPQAIADERARFVVMATHGRTGPARWLLGSLTEEVLRRSDAPVIVVPDGYLRYWSGGAPLRILVALDGTDLAEEALAPAAELAEMTGGTLVLTRVVAPRLDVEDYHFSVADGGDVGLNGLVGQPLRVQARVDEADAYLADAAARVHGLAPHVETRVELGDVEDALAGAAVATGAHLIAMATHRRGELARLLLGSHAMATLRRADVPVMMVRPAAHAADAAGSPDGQAVPRGPVTIDLDAEELDLVRCGLNRLLDDPNAGEELERTVFALEDRLSQAVKASATVAVGAGR